MPTLVAMPASDLAFSAQPFPVGRSTLADHASMRSKVALPALVRVKPIVHITKWQSHRLSLHVHHA
jgi:hypothetical protein